MYSSEIIVALAGNPNTGKSTVFNNLTGLKQHTGNWPGKTVASAQGRFTHNDYNYTLVDLPGTYSLFANSMDEKVARDFICFNNPHVTVVVADATCLERNLNLLLQILELTDKVILCVNLMDEAKRKKIRINLPKLSSLLGIPVVGISARNKKELKLLKQIIHKVATGEILPAPLKISYNAKIEKGIRLIKDHIADLVDNPINYRWMALRLINNDKEFVQDAEKVFKIDLTNDSQLQRQLRQIKNQLSEVGILPNLNEEMVIPFVKTAERICCKVISYPKNAYNQLDRRIDSIVTSKHLGIPIMLALLGLVFWITIQGANVPSNLLAKGFFWIETQLTLVLQQFGTPAWALSIFISGIFRTLAWVVSVMLPPMAIFFPLFTLLEDLGYLPRIAFNLDHYFKKACAHGKQALTMCMGFGCNAAGITSCRIIDSPRERLIAIITNNFVPCNGRFPTLIALAGIFVSGATGILHSFTATISVVMAIVLGVGITFLTSRLLSHTVLKGLPSSFILELPPYRKPQIGKIIIRSIFDRTLFVLGRAVAIAAPAGVIIWFMANISVNDISLLTHSAQFLDPFARLIGLDGYILMAFILGLPANEIVIPILIMSYMAKSSMLELGSLAEMKELFVDNGWTWVTAICTMLFSLNHWPCGTTLWTIHKETQSWKWTWISFLVPTIIGIILCFTVNSLVKLLGI